MSRLKAIYVMREDFFPLAFGAEERAQVATLVDVIAPPQTTESVENLSPAVLGAVDVVISGWGPLRLDGQWLARMPRLRATFHAGGSVAHLMTADAWNAGILVSSAQVVNAIPVAEYTVAMMVLSLKRVWPSIGRHGAHTFGLGDIPGCFERVFGLVSLGAVGRAVATRLRTFDGTVIAYDPYCTTAQAGELDVTLVSLDELFRLADVISVHTPLLPETEHLIRGHHLATMKPWATFINTARAQLVCERELAAIAVARPDLQVVLDVVADAHAPAESLLARLPNVVITPHVAGSYGSECRRLGRWTVRELERYVTSRPLLAQVSREQADGTSHLGARALP